MYYSHPSCLPLPFQYPPPPSKFLVFSPLSHSYFSAPNPPRTVLLCTWLLRCLRELKFRYSCDGTTWRVRERERERVSTELCRQSNAISYQVSSYFRVSCLVTSKTTLIAELTILMWKRCREARTKFIGFISSSSAYTHLY